MRTATGPQLLIARTRRLCRACRLWLCLLCLSIAGPQLSQAQVGSASESTLKIAFVYNFAKFTEWPAGALGPAQRPVYLCVIGEADSFGPGLAAVDGRPLAGRELKVRRIARAAEIGACNILFIARSEERRLPELLSQAHAQSVLTISDIGDFVDADGIIGFVNVDNKVQFEINLRSAKSANLRISSEVLKLARTVVGK